VSCLQLVHHVPKRNAVVSLMSSFLEQAKRSFVEAARNSLRLRLYVLCFQRIQSCEYIMSCRQYVVKTSNIIVTTYFRPSVMMMAARNTLTVGGAHTDACYRRACAQCGRIRRAAGARNSTPSTLNMTLPTFAADRRRLQHGAPTYLHTRRSPANPPAVAAVDRRDRQTDGHPTVTKTLLYLLCEQRQ